MAEASCSLIVVLVLCILWLVARWHVSRRLQPPASKETLQRLLKPRTPDDCPACRRRHVRPSSTPAQRSPVRPRGVNSKAAVVPRNASSPTASAVRTRPVPITRSRILRSMPSLVMAGMGRPSVSRPFAVKPVG